MANLRPRCEAFSSVAARPASVPARRALSPALARSWPVYTASVTLASLPSHPSPRRIPITVPILSAVGRWRSRSARRAAVERGPDRMRIPNREGRQTSQRMLTLSTTCADAAKRHVAAVEINWRYSVPEQMQLIDGKYCSQPASAGAAPPSPWPVALWQWAQFSV
jgi:hypothetical protein